MSGCDLKLVCLHRVPLLTQLAKPRVSTNCLGARLKDRALALLVLNVDMALEGCLEGSLTNYLRRLVVRHSWRPVLKG